MKKIALFASGSGTNAAKIMDYFANSSTASVVLVVCNNAQAGVLDRALSRGVPTLLVDKSVFFSEASITQELLNKKIDLIVLAGFLWLIPKSIIRTFDGKIINIHPALLPKYGGKGMYGTRVHQAVIDAQEIETGITIHFVNEHFDEGEIICQRKCTLDSSDTAESVAKKVQQLEHQFYPQEIEKILLKQLH